MSKAAQELYVAQPSLSRTIARLEDELGVPLFDRLGWQIQLNQLGHTFLHHVERAFAELEEGKKKCFLWCRPATAWPGGRASL